MYIEFLSLSLYIYILYRFYQTNIIYKFINNFIYIYIYILFPLPPNSYPILVGLIDIMHPWVAYHHCGGKQIMSGRSQVVDLQG